METAKHVLACAWFIGFLSLGAMAISGFKEYNQANIVMAKERTVQAALLSSEPKAYKVQKDSIIARYLDND